MHLRRRKSKADLVMERVQEISETLADKATDLSGKAAVALAPKVGTAREAASSAYEQASVLVRDDVVPKVREAAVPAVAAALARRQAPEPEKKHRLRKLLFLLGLGGAVAYAAKRFGLLGGSSDSSFGQTSPSGSSYAGSAYSTATPVRPSAVPDARDEADPLQGGDTEAAGATFADSDSETGADTDTDTELGRDLTDKLSEDETSEGTQDETSEGTQDETSEGTQDFDTEFTTTPPTEAAPEAAETGSETKSSRGRRGSST